FNTTGVANLTISAVDGTIWNNIDETEDLKFLQIKCGEEILNHSWVNNSVFVEDCSCNSSGYAVFKVLSVGKHILKFKFGDIDKFAYNFASGAESIVFVDPTLPNDTQTSNNYVFVNITSTDDLNQSFLKWGNASGFTNISMSNYSLTKWYVNRTLLSDYNYNYSIWAQNTSGDWQESNIQLVGVNTTVPAIMNGKLYVSLNLPNANQVCSVQSGTINSQIASFNYNNPTDAYIASFSNNILFGLASKSATQITAQNYSSSHTISIYANDEVYLGFTKGDCSTIGKKYSRIKEETLLHALWPAFAYSGRSDKISVTIGATYNNINITGYLDLGEGNYNTRIENLGTDSSGQPIVNIRRN
ncbi:MAG: hypothetical protein KAQ92_04490, partial [Candidatus Aenigmarchaeota archaeon]|nr:hypothetical protein [Candidatus Aenigmarchaeota archaeon]